MIAKYEVMIDLASNILPYLAILTSYLLPILFYALSFKHKSEVKDEKILNVIERYPFIIGFGDNFVVFHALCAFFTRRKQKTSHCACNWS